jgi:hypothetical protein
MNATNSIKTKPFYAREEGVAFPLTGCERETSSGLDSMLEFQLSVDMKNKVCAAKGLLQRRRGMYWSFSGRAADAPMSPDAAQSEFSTTVQAAVESYFEAVRSTAN